MALRRFSVLRRCLLEDATCLITAAFRRLLLLVLLCDDDLVETEDGGLGGSRDDETLPLLLVALVDAAPPRSFIKSIYQYDFWLVTELEA